MRKYYKAIFAVAAAVAVVACTKVDDTLGVRFIPRDQRMELRIDTVNVFDTYLATNDSVAASSYGMLYVGNSVDPVFGGIRAAGMTDFYPVSSWNDDKFFGHGPVADSLFLFVDVAGITGSTAVEQKFNVYALRDSMQRDSVYERGAPADLIERHVDMTRPLFKFTVKDELKEGFSARIKLNPTDDGKAFMQRLADVDAAVYAEPWPEFHKQFYGLYFKADDASPDDAAVYGVNLRGTSSLVLYFHNYKEDDPGKVDTVTYAEYLFTDTGWTTSNTVAVNMNVNRVDFDYPPAIADRLNDTVTGPPLEKVYVQGLGGVASYLKVSDDFMAYLEGLKTQDGTTYSNVMINQARLYVPLDGPTPETMDLAPKRLGMYYTYGLVPVPVPDYQYDVENNSSYYSASPWPFGGYMSRSKGTGYYQMNITNYVTALMLRPSATPQRIWLGPEVNTRAAGYSRAVLKGGEGIKLVVTYTLVK